MSPNRPPTEGYATATRIDGLYYHPYQIQAHAMIKVFETARAVTLPPIQNKNELIPLKKRAFYYGYTAAGSSGKKDGGQTSSSSLYKSLFSAGKKEPPSMSGNVKEYMANTNAVRSLRRLRQQENSCCSQSRPYLTYITMTLLSGPLLALSLTATQWMYHINPVQVLCIQAATQSLVSAAIMLVVKENPMGQEGYRKITAIRSVMLSASIILLYTSLQLLPLLDIVVLILHIQLLTTIFKLIVMKKTFHYYYFLHFVLVATAALFLWRPDSIFHMEDSGSLGRIGGLLCAYGSAVLYSLSSVLTVDKISNIHYSTSIFQSSTLTTIFALIILFAFDSWNFSVQSFYWEFLMTNGVWTTVSFILIGQLSRQKSVPESIINLFRSFDLVWAALLQIFLLKEMVVCATYVSATCIVITSIVEFTYEMKDRTNNNNITPPFGS